MAPEDLRFKIGKAADELEKSKQLMDEIRSGELISGGYGRRLRIVVGRNRREQSYGADLDDPVSTGNCACSRPPQLYAQCT